MPFWRHWIALHNFPFNVYDLNQFKLIHQTLTQKNHLNRNIKNVKKLAKYDIWQDFVKSDLLIYCTEF